MADSFRLSLSFFERGAIEARVSGHGQNLTMFPTYISDAPGDLAEAALSLLISQWEAVRIFSWQDEPGEWRWILRREGENTRIEILRFAETFSSLLDGRGEPVFRAECSARRFATQVKGALHQALNARGEPGYLARWRHPFPMRTFRRLETALSETRG